MYRKRHWCSETSNSRKGRINEKNEDSREKRGLTKKGGLTRNGGLTRKGGLTRNGGLMGKRRIYEKKEKLVKKIEESIRTCLSEIKIWRTQISLK